MFISLTLIFLVAALVGGATFALFTDTSTNVGNSFQAGTVIVRLSESTILETDAFKAENMAPGDVIRGSFTIKNDGTLDQWYRIVPIFDDGTLFTGDWPAVLTIKDYDYKAEDPWKELKAGDSVEVEFELALDENAGNYYQEAEGAISFRVDAQQVRNNSDKSATEFVVSPVK